MTREEITEVNKILDYTKKVNIVAYKALKKALEQEPCEDAVSRKEVKEAIMKCETISEDIMDGYIDSTTKLEVEIDCIPSVTPKRKKGKWERGYSFPDGEYVKCTVCGEIIKCIYPMHFCPNCGAEMESEE